MHQKNVNIKLIHIYDDISQIKIEYIKIQVVCSGISYAKIFQVYRNLRMDYICIIQGNYPSTKNISLLERIY